MWQNPFRVGMEYRDRHCSLRVVKIVGSQMWVEHLNGDTPGLMEPEPRTVKVQATIWENVQRDQRILIQAEQSRLQMARAAAQSRTGCERLAEEKRFEREAIIARIATTDEARAIAEHAKKCGDWELVRDAWDRAYEIQPSKYSLIASAAASRRLGDREAAIQKCRTVLDRSPGDSAALNELAAILRDEGDPSQSYRLYHEVLAREPYNIYALNGVGGACFDMGLFEEAEKCFRQAANLSGDIPKGNTLANIIRLRDFYREHSDFRGAQRLTEVIEQLQSRL